MENNKRSVCVTYKHDKEGYQCQDEIFTDINVLRITNGFVIFEGKDKDGHQVQKRIDEKVIAQLRISGYESPAGKDDDCE